MTTRTITKKTGETFTVLLDDADAAYYDQYNWCMVKGYAARRRGKTTATLHRLLMSEPKGRMVDHRNGNPLDNRRENLRVSTVSQNGTNRHRQGNNTSGYVGVSLHRQGKWMASLMLNRKNIYLGLHDTAIEAAIARDRGALEYHGEFARLNFPELALAN